MLTPHWITWGLRTCCIILALCSSPLWAITISVSSNWSLHIGSGDLQAGAGSDVRHTYTTPAGTPPALSILNTGNGEWRVDARRSDTAWYHGLTLAVKRLDGGSGSGSISGGDSFQIVDGTDATLFSGTNDRTNIAIQVQLGGVSYAIPPATYTTTILYTVTGL